MRAERLGLALLATSALAYWAGAALGILLVLAYPLCLAALVVLATRARTRPAALATLAVLVAWAALLALSGGVTLRGGAGAGAQAFPIRLDLVALLGVPAIAAIFPAIAAPTAAPRWLGRASVACTTLVVAWVCAEAITGRVAGGLIGPAMGAMLLGTLAVFIMWTRAPPRVAQPTGAAL